MHDENCNNLIPKLFPTKEPTTKTNNGKIMAVIRLLVSNITPQDITANRNPIKKYIVKSMKHKNRNG